MRHHRGAQNADAHVKHLLVLEDFGAGNESQKDLGQIWLGKKELERKTGSDRQDQCDDKSFDITKSFVLEIEDGKHIQRCNDAAPDQWNPKEKLQRNR